MKALLPHSVERNHEVAIDLQEGLLSFGNNCSENLTRFRTDFQKILIKRRLNGLGEQRSPMKTGAECSETNQIAFVWAWITPPFVGGNEHGS
jgi:hypothetical protein